MTEIHQGMRPPVLKRPLNRLHRWIAEPPESVEGQRAYDYAITAYAMLMGFLCHASWIPLFWWLGEHTLATINVASATCFIIAIFLTRRGQSKLALTFGSVEVIAHAVFATRWMGWDANFQIYLFLLVVLWALYRRVSRWERILYTLGPICIYVYLFATHNPTETMTGGTTLSPATLDGLARMNMSAFVLVMAGICAYYTLSLAKVRKEGQLASEGLMDPLLNLGISATEHDEEERQRIRTINFIAITATGITVTYTLTFALFGLMRLSLFNAFFVAWYASIPLWNVRGFARAAGILMMAGGIVHLAGVPMLFLSADSGIQFFLFVIPIFSLVTIHKSNRRWMGTILLTAMVCLSLVEWQDTLLGVPWKEDLNATLAMGLRIGSAIGTVLLTAVVVGLFQLDIREARRRYEESNAKLAAAVSEEQEANARLDREARGRVESQQYFIEHMSRVAGLAELSDLSSTHDTEEGLLQTFAHVSRRVTGADHLDLVLLDDSGTRFRPILLHHKSGVSAADWVGSDDVPWVSEILEGGRQVLDDIGDEDPPWAQRLKGLDCRSAMAMPIYAGRTAIAALTAASRFDKHFDRPTQNVMQEYAASIGANLGLFRALRSLESNLSRADAVLVSVLPPAVSQRLKGGESKIADRIPLAGVFFSDIVGFTTYASQNEPEVVVGMLEDVFGLMERDCATHDVEKIKTIGDAFMAVSGVSLEVEDPIGSIAAFALNAAQSLNVYFKEHEIPLNFRIGIHAGSVMAGVLGSDRLFFDIWGDTVNMASRLESTGATGEIRCSERIKTALEGTWRFRDCGTIPMKGKGEPRVWQLLDRKTDDDD